MKREFIKKQQHSFNFQKCLKTRSNLPIFKKKAAILDVIRDNSVVIVHGGTGCGKTTQVSKTCLDIYTISFIPIIIKKKVGLSIHTR